MAKRILRFRTCEIPSNGTIRFRGFRTKRDLEKAEKALGKLTIEVSCVGYWAGE